MLLQATAEFEGFPPTETAELGNARQTLSRARMRRGEKIVATLAAAVIIAGFATGLPTAARPTAAMIASASLPAGHMRAARLGSGYVQAEPAPRRQVANHHGPYSSHRG